MLKDWSKGVYVGAHTDLRACMLYSNAKLPWCSVGSSAALLQARRCTAAPASTLSPIIEMSLVAVEVKQLLLIQEHVVDDRFHFLTHAS